MNVDDFRALYISELQELRSAEALLVDALGTMAEVAGHRLLQEAIRSHLNETRSQCERLDGLLQSHSANPREHRDQSMLVLVREASKWADMIPDPDLRDCGLIASAQRIEHYEIAVYGTLATWAKQLDLQRDLSTLLGNLEEERSADSRLTEIAKEIVNPDAAATGRRQ